MKLRQRNMASVVMGLGAIGCVVFAGAAAAAIAVPNACVTVFDTTPPSITLLGDTAVSVLAGSSYVDAGATATDVLEGDLTLQIVVNSGVNMAVPGVYTVTYTVTDAAGNAAAQVVRTVTVSQNDVTKPVITLLGSPSASVEVFKTYTDAGATAMDDTDGDITARIVKAGAVDTAKLGSYTITYTVSDAAGNAAVPVSRSVRVVDVTPPVIVPK